MEYVGLWVTNDDIKNPDKNQSNKYYDTNNYLKVIS